MAQVPQENSNLHRRLVLSSQVLMVRKNPYVKFRSLSLCRMIELVRVFLCCCCCCCCVCISGGLNLGSEFNPEKLCSRDERYHCGGLNRDVGPSPTPKRGKKTLLVRFVFRHRFNSYAGRFLNGSFPVRFLVVLESRFVSIRRLPVYMYLHIHIESFLLCMILHGKNMANNALGRI